LIENVRSTTASLNSRASLIRVETVRDKRGKMEKRMQKRGYAMPAA
jgi:hypothetical protein